MMHTGHSWLFRAASKTEEGGGHVTRSLALAQVWFAPVVFSVERDSPFADKIRKAGFDVIYTDQESECYDGIFLDFYVGDFDRYRNKTDRLVIIEDHRDLYDKADIYIRPYETALRQYQGALILNGLNYALIGGMYSTRLPKNPRKIETVAVALGQYDSNNATYYVLEKLEQRPEKFQTIVVLGEYAKHRQMVESYLIHDYGRPYDLVINAPDLCAVYQKTDVLISMGGTTNLEACALEIPSCALNVNDNQGPISRVLRDRGLLAYAGMLGTDDEYLEAALDDLFDLRKREKMCKALQDALDTNGVKRIAHEVGDHIQKVLAV